MAFNRMCKVWMVFKMARELIRKATLEDMPVLLEIYDRARKFMVSTGMDIHHEKYWLKILKIMKCTF